MKVEFTVLEFTVPQRTETAVVFNFAESYDEDALVHSVVKAAIAGCRMQLWSAQEMTFSDLALIRDTLSRLEAKHRPDIALLFFDYPAKSVQDFITKWLSFEEASDV